MIIYAMLYIHKDVGISKTVEGCRSESGLRLPLPDMGFHLELFSSNKSPAIMECGFYLSIFRELTAPPSTY